MRTFRNQAKNIELNSKSKQNFYKATDRAKSPLSIYNIIYILDYEITQDDANLNKLLNENFPGEEDFAEDMNIVQSMWDDLGVKDDYRTIFEQIAKELDESSRKEFFEFENSSLKKFSDNLQKLSKEIQNREKSLTFLQQFTDFHISETNSAKREALTEKNLADIIQCFKNFRIQSINIVNHYNKIREICSYNIINGKFNLDKLNKNYLFDRNYLLKMKFDNEFLKSSFLNKYFEFSEQADPFLTALNEKPQNSNKHQVKINEDMLKSIKQSQFYIIQDIVFYQMETLKQNKKNLEKQKKIQSNLYSTGRALSSKENKITNGVGFYNIRNTSNYKNLFFNQSKTERKKIQIESKNKESAASIYSSKTQENFRVFNNIKIENERPKPSEVGKMNSKKEHNNFQKHNNHFSPLKEKEVKVIEKISYESKKQNTNEAVENKFESIHKKIEESKNAKDSKPDSSTGINKQKRPESGRKISATVKQKNDSLNFINENEHEQSSDENIEMNIEGGLLNTNDFKDISRIKSELNEKNVSKQEIAEDIEDKLNKSFKRPISSKITISQKITEKKSEKSKSIVNNENIEGEVEENYSFDEIDQPYQLDQLDQLEEIGDIEIEAENKADFNANVMPNELLDVIKEDSMDYKGFESQGNESELTLEFYKHDFMKFEKQYHEFTSGLNEEQKIAFKPSTSINNYNKGINPKIILGYSKSNLVSICFVSYDSSYDLSLRLNINHFSTKKFNNLEQILVKQTEFILNNFIFDEIIIDIFYEFKNNSFSINTFIRDILNNTLHFKWAKLENRIGERVQKMSLKNQIHRTVEQKEKLKEYKHLLHINYGTVIDLEQIRNNLETDMGDIDHIKKERFINLFSLMYTLIELTKNNFKLENSSFDNFNSDKLLVHILT